MLDLVEEQVQQLVQFSIKRFINNVNWIHLDIAGVTWAKSDKPLIPKGGTGFGVRLLEELVLRYLQKLD